MRAQRKNHKDVEFAVNDAQGHERIFKTFNEAAGFAITMSGSGSSREERGESHIDVLIHSVSGARWWGGDYAVEEYKSDPDASVSDRITVRAEHVGRVY